MTVPFARADAPECVAVKGALLSKKNDLAWEPIKAGAAVPFDRTLVALFQADLRSPNRAVEFRLRGEAGELGPLPAFESAVTIHDNPKVDLDLTLERGIVVLINKKKDGPASVDLRIRGKTLNISLREPEARLGVNLYSRHAPGLAAIKSDDPTLFVFMLNAKGSVQIHHMEKEVALKAPPGPAMLRWDSAVREVDVEHLDKLPEWLSPDSGEAKIHERICEIAEPLAGGDARAAFLKLLFSDDALERKVGLTAVGALGTPAPLFAVLQQSKHADARQFAVLVLRNWLGRDVGQIAKLEAACAAAGLSKTNAESLLHLLLGFDDEERRAPATYQMLIEGLGHSKLLVRELCHWHLVRMAPVGREIAYDPAGTPEHIAAGVRQWRELIPAGQLPPEKK